MQDGEQPRHFTITAGSVFRQSDRVPLNLFPMPNPMKAFFKVQYKCFFCLV